MFVSQHVKRFLTSKAKNRPYSTPVQAIPVKHNDKWVKRSSERLSTILTQFNAIRDAFASHEECDCLLDQLTDEVSSAYFEACVDWNEKADTCFEKLLNDIKS